MVHASPEELKCLFYQEHILYDKETQSIQQRVFCDIFNYALIYKTTHYVILSLPHLSK